jgi:hypothetical protein
VRNVSSIRGSVRRGRERTAAGAEDDHHSTHFLALARKGAEHRYAELKAEIVSLLKAFPDLKTHRSGRRPATAIDISSEPAAMIDQPRRKRRKMSAAARRKISLAQKRRWAKQKAVKA